MNLRKHSISPLLESLKMNRIDRLGPITDNSNMSTVTIKSELRDIADRIPDSASYNDAMYQLYVRMKIAKGKQAADEGRIISHDEVKRRFAK